ncbi:MAG: hypothetical protein DRJ15_16400 [Bacteroidetes bacterium]|nr:MAG: hypothetical protein DRJ15_16400 [Bacteroidota bacterium]
MYKCVEVNNWKVIGNKLIINTEESATITIKDQIFEEGSIVEINTDTIVKLGKPAPTMVHTKRVCAIFKSVIADIKKQERKGYLNPYTTEVLARTSKNSLPNITKTDIEGMFKELGL